MASSKPSSETPNSLQEAIRQAFHAKVHELESLLSSGAIEADAELQNHPLVREGIELEPWAYPENFTTAERRARAERIERLCSLLPARVAGAFTMAMQPQPGAPVKPETRRLAMEAEEARRRDPAFSWQRFANSHCKCGNLQHDSHCKERIRQAAMELQSLLRKFGVKLRNPR